MTQIFVSWQSTDILIDEAHYNKPTRWAEKIYMAFNTSFKVHAFDLDNMTRYTQTISACCIPRRVLRHTYAPNLFVVGVTLSRINY